MKRSMLIHEKPNNHVGVPFSLDTIEWRMKNEMRLEASKRKLVRKLKPIRPKKIAYSSRSNPYSQLFQSSHIHGERERERETGRKTEMKITYTDFRRRFAWTRASSIHDKLGSLDIWNHTYSLKLNGNLCFGNDSIIWLFSRRVAVIRSLDNRM